MTRLSESSLEGLRSCLRPDYAGMSSEALEGMVEVSLSGLSADIAEDFLKSLGTIGKTVAPALQRAAPSILQAALTGASVGGPFGALAGAGAAVASTALGGQGKPRPPSAPVPTTAAAPALPTGAGAAGTLLSLFQNPTVQQALLSQVLGTSGAQNIGTPSSVTVPRAAINGLLSQLLANATEALAEADSEAEQTYLQSAEGEYLIDPASPDQQAALVLSQLGNARRGARQSASDELLESTEWLSAEFADAESDDAVEFY